MLRRTSLILGISLFSAVVFALTGCGKTDNKGAQATDKDKGKQVAKNDHKHDHDHKKDGDKHDHAKDDKKPHDHSGWWCDDHGIPEEECSMCSAKVEKESKDKGDWCEKHERAMSQCFHCKPDRRAFYAAKHKAKTGKEPPPIPEFDDKKPKADDKDKKGGK